MKLPVYNTEGKKVKDLELNPAVFEVKTKPELLHQSVEAQRANTREAIAHAKDRSEVRGGGKKPWRQKGTGRARHGSIRSPLWAGGGVTFGPRNTRNFSKSINKKIKRQALLMALSEKASEKGMKILDTLTLKERKTKQIANMLKKLKVDKNKVILALDKKDEIIIHSARNIPHVQLVSADSLNVIDLLRHDVLLTTEAGVKKIEKTYAT